MKSNLFISILFFFCIQFLHAQCPDYVTLKTQEDVDEYVLNYPDCTEAKYFSLGSSVYADTSNIKDISGLSSLRRIENNLALYKLDSLTDFSGLENIEYIGNEFKCYRTAHLSFEKFNNLKMIGGNLFFYETANENLEGLTNLDSINGTLMLHHTKIKSLDGLENLKHLDQLEIGGHDPEFISWDHIELTENLELESISALKGITKLSSVSIYNAPKLRNLSGLENLTELNVLILREQNVTTLAALSNLQFLDGLIIGGVLVNSETSPDFLIDYKKLESSVQSLEGLENIDSLTSLVIIQSELENLEGLNNLRSVYQLQLGSFRYTFPNATVPPFGNFSLENIDALSNLEEVGYMNFILNNKYNGCGDPILCRFINDLNYYESTGSCSNKDDLIDNCFSKARFKIFYDNNANGILDQDDYGVGIGKMENPMAGADFFDSYPSSEGDLSAYISFSNSEIFEFISPENYKVTSPDSVFTLDLNFDVSEIIYIGIAPTQTIESVSSHLFVPPIICDDESTIQINTINNGTENAAVNLEFYYDGDFLNSELPYSDLDLLNKVVKFDLGVLKPGKNRKFEIYLSNPSIGNTPEQNRLKYSIHSNIDGCNTCMVEKEYSTELLCAYDPNDKVCHPPGVQDENYTLFGETLEYHIRFQNLGNYYARDIVIEDVIDRDLDISTFKFLDASHELDEVIIDKTISSQPKLKFIFKDINLPWADMDEAGSNGYITYAINHNENPDENQVVNNTAIIYFDSNPGIITNTTKNTLVSVIPTVSTYDLEAKGFQIFPNPASSFVTLNFNNYNKPLNYQLLNDLGQSVMSGTINNDQTKIDIQKLDAGIYFFSINEEVRKLVVLHN